MKIPITRNQKKKQKKTTEQEGIKSFFTTKTIKDNTKTTKEKSTEK